VLLGYSLDGLNDRRSVRHALHLTDCKRTHALSGAEKGPRLAMGSRITRRNRASTKSSQGLYPKLPYPKML
jgi:hypothetical protein